jgi:hypothetical protein
LSYLAIFLADAYFPRYSIPISQFLNFSTITELRKARMGVWETFGVKIILLLAIHPTELICGTGN